MTATRLFDRAIVRLTSEDPDEDVIAFLQGLVTNDVTGTLPAYAGLLTPQGKTLFDFLVWPGAAGEVLIDCEAEAAEDLAKRLSLYRLRRKIAIAVDAGVAMRWLAPGADSDEAADADWRAHRLALGVPEGRAELGDILWLETNAAELHGVSFGKGCYIGQENTARMNWRSKVNRRLVVVPLERSDDKRRKADYPDLGLAVDHLRVDAIDADSAPEWMRDALSPAAE